MSWIETAENNLIYEFDLPGGRNRLKEAIMYVCDKAAGMSRFGAVKLNKILWRADFRAYLERGIPVTGRQYQRLPQGPAPVETLPVVGELLRQGYLKIVHRKAGKQTEHRHIALAQANLRLFSPEDLSYLDEAISHYRNMTGTETSEESHGMAWKSRHDGEAIPYQSALLSDEVVSERQLKHIFRLGEKSGWSSL